jgi:phosphatidylserine decarboxylase
MNLDFLNRFIHPIHKDGYIFIAIVGFCALVLNAISSFLGFVGLVLFVWCIYFFRNPSRYVPQNKGLIVAAADGIVVDVCKARPPAELDIPLDREFIRISTYLSVFDAHIQRTPVAGIIERVEYNKGKFVSAAKEKASDDNERNSILIKTDDGHSVAVVQIAGYVARRIVCWVKEGKNIAAGERFGLIRFGSRVDVYLPEGVMPRVAVGQRMIAGETVIANINEHSEPLTVKED